MRKETPEQPVMPSEDLIRRVRGEFYEMPGLRLTIEQACRLWQLDETTCEAILTNLVTERVLYRSANGYYTSSLPHSPRAMSVAERNHA